MMRNSHFPPPSGRISESLSNQRGFTINQPSPPLSTSSSSERKDEKVNTPTTFVGNSPDGYAIIYDEPLPATPPPLLRTSRRTLALSEDKKLTNGKRTGGVSAKLPPPFNATTRCFIHRRFRANSTSTSGTITLSSLIGSCGVIGTVTNTTVTSMFSAIKLMKIVIWPPQNSGSDRTILEWGASADGGYTPDSAFINTVPDGITETTGQTFHPPANSLLNNWMSTYLTASNIIAYITCPTGTIIDTYVTACQPNDFVPESISVTTAVIGSVYYLPLDSLSTHVLLPVGLATTY
jgi:hypothetical protein